MKIWTVDDVMTQAVVTAGPATTYRELVDLLVSRRFSAVPVVDEFQRVTGLVSEADLLRKIEYAGDDQPRMFESRRRRGERAKAHARTAADLMSRPPVTVLAGATLVAAARTMDDEQVKRLPVVDGLGRLVGIVTRGDLLKVHLRPDDEIKAEVVDDVFGRYLIGSDTSVTVEVENGVVTLTGRADRWSAADMALRLTRKVAGVVEVVGKMSYDFDDRQMLSTGLGFGSA
ncbi:CBS domain-containing protein [Paractinoplanes atraurantiacus]|uniref:CBS domain-containing protein n=1 Tax=Paractinoplanes atraurantiacus TaxID=1036182 RepID=A0A285JFV8_9ACTN|nr:CBS domain-containing protein [Actinoplanes atraurantiacus]SNY59135.1 CBS domain-containing protein [Actinoplanes atraurantiacus]